jgi:hypothetical protein
LSSWGHDVSFSAMTWQVLLHAVSKMHLTLKSYVKRLFKMA